MARKHRNSCLDRSMRYTDVTGGSRVSRGGSRFSTGLKISIKREEHTFANNSVRYSVIFHRSIQIQIRRDACRKDERCEISRNFDINKLVTGQDSGFGGLGDACWPLVPGRSRRIFQGEKIPSTPSLGGEVKSSVPCRR
jgi:hypothetical protein